MDTANCQLAYGLVSRSYISQGQQSLNARHARVKALLSSRRLPQDGWDEATIEMFMQDLSAMDSNNFLGNVGVGEREARVACPLVARRYWNLAHGIGRSGDIAAEQPKAAGSSLISKLCNILMADALHIAGLSELTAVTVLPLATGMAMTMTLLALRPHRSTQAKYVVWSRIDQKTCLKCIVAANLEPLVVPLIQRGDELQTDVEGILTEVQRVGAEQVVCVITTTSCFAPRGSDDVVAVAKACASLNIPHIINNAYGVQCAQLCKAVTAACRKGRVDAVIQSSDKNFMVPVGGAIVAAPGGKSPLKLVEAVNQLYPGRAAASAHLDLLLTLLHWGVKGWKKVLLDREELYPYMKQKLEETAQQLGEQVLHTPNNPISIALSLDALAAHTTGSHPCTTQTPFPQQQDHTPASKPHPTGAGAETPTVTEPSNSQPPTCAVAAARVPTRVLDGTANSSKSSSSVQDSDTLSAQLASGAAASTALTADVATNQGESVIPAASIAQAAAEIGAFAAKATGGGEHASDVFSNHQPAPASTTADKPTADPSSTSKKSVDLTMLGSMLWSRFVSGTRVVTGRKNQKVAGIAFQGYGAHHDTYTHQYLTVAAALGTTREDVDEFCRRLVKCYEEFKRKHALRS